MSEQAGLIPVKRMDTNTVTLCLDLLVNETVKLPASPDGYDRDIYLIPGDTLKTTYTFDLVVPDNAAARLGHLHRTRNTLGLMLTGGKASSDDPSMNILIDTVTRIARLGYRPIPGDRPTTHTPPTLRQRMSRPFQWLVQKFNTLTS